MHDRDDAVSLHTPSVVRLAAFPAVTALFLAATPAWAAQGLFDSSRKITETLLAVVLTATALFALVVGGVMLLKRMHGGPGDTRLESDEYERRHT